LGIQEQGYLSGIALGYGRNDRGFESRQELGIFLFITASKPALEPTQYVTGSLFSGGKNAET
jgi:hypothetical protein